MSTERDAGLAALQQSDAAAAVEHLEKAIQESPDDYQAHMYLGAAYGQVGRANDAVQVLTRAVQIDPANAQARYNLGIALERAGWKEQALQAFQQAVTLQPDYGRAQEGIARLQPAAPPAPSAIPQAPEPTIGTPTMQSAAGMAGAPIALGQPYGQPAPLAGPLPLGGPQPLGAPRPMAGPQLGQPGLQPGQPGGWMAPPGGQPGAPYGQPPYAQPAPGTLPGGYRRLGLDEESTEDKFDLAEGLKAWGQVLIAPTRFFAGQVGREGMKAPLAAIMCYWLVWVIFGAAAAIKLGMSSVNGTGLGIATILGLVVLYPLLVLGMLFQAALTHGVGRLFGNSATYAGSFRVVAYAYGPYALFAIFVQCASIAMPVPASPGTASAAGYVIQAQFGGRGGAQPGMPGDAGGALGGRAGRLGAGGQMPFGRGPVTAASLSPQTMNMLFVRGILAFIGFVWSMIVFGIGVANIQRIGTGGAIGVIVLVAIVDGAIVLLLSLILGAAIFAAAVASGPK